MDGELRTVTLNRNPSKDGAQKTGIGIIFGRPEVGREASGPYKIHSVASAGTAFPDPWQTVLPHHSHHLDAACPESLEPSAAPDARQAQPRANLSTALDDAASVPKHPTVQRSHDCRRH